MSHYVDVYTVVRDQDALVKALERMGFKGKIEVVATAQALVGYEGDKREQKAHVIIRRQHVGAASNDIGFERMPNGQFVSHISEYDQHQYNQKWQNQLYTWYGVEATKLACDKEKLRYTEDMDEKQRPRIRVTV